MAKVLAFIEVEDFAKWEAGFQTHGELLRKQTVTTCHYTQSAENEVAICFEVEDIDMYFAVIESEETAEAMEFDGVNRDTVMVVELDRQFTP